MIRRSVHWTEPAIRDLLTTRARIEAHDPLVAARVARGIIDAVDRLETLPNRGRPGRVPGTRELVLAGWPWIVVYAVGEDRVEVLRVLHGASIT